MLCFGWITSVRSYHAAIGSKLLLWLCRSWWHRRAAIWIEVYWYLIWLVRNDYLKVWLCKLVACCWLSSKTERIRVTTCNLFLPPTSKPGSQATTNHLSMLHTDIFWMSTRLQTIQNWSSCFSFSCAVTLWVFMVWYLFWLCLTSVRDSFGWHCSKIYLRSCHVAVMVNDFCYRGGSGWRRKIGWGWYRPWRSICV